MEAQRKREIQALCDAKKRQVKRLTEKHLEVRSLCVLPVNSLFFRLSLTCAGVSPDQSVLQRNYTSGALHSH
jgi:hypothetical protein